MNCICYSKYFCSLFTPHTKFRLPNYIFFFSHINCYLKATFDYFYDDDMVYVTSFFRLKFHQVLNFFLITRDSRAPKCITSQKWIIKCINCFTANFYRIKLSHEKIWKLYLILYPHHFNLFT